jgi:hypothetical protein
MNHIAMIKSSSIRNGTLANARKITYGGPYYMTLALSTQTGCDKNKSHLSHNKVNNIEKSI